MQRVDERKSDDFGAAAPLLAGRRRWTAPTITRAGAVSALVQTLKASGGDDCGGYKHHALPDDRDVCGL
jgi:hypothetical protein